MTPTVEKLLEEMAPVIERLVVATAAREVAANVAPLRARVSALESALAAILTRAVPPAPPEAES